MAANPLTNLELEAFCRLRGLALRRWEVETIFRLDDAVLALMAKRRPSAQDEPAMVPMSDTAGVRAVLKGALARARARQKAKDG